MTNSHKQDKPTKFFWVDLEMTGLKVDEDRILEVGVVVTDNKFNELANYSSSIAHDLEKTRRQLEADKFWGERPEQIEQILNDMRHGKPEKQVEDELISMTERYFLPGESVYLAGSSVWVDRSFINAWLPRFAARLHYRMLDVTAFKLWWLATGRSEFAAPKEHRAVDDIRRSMAELKYYTTKFNLHDRS